MLLVAVLLSLLCLSFAPPLAFLFCLFLGREVDTIVAVMTASDAPDEWNQLQRWKSGGRFLPFSKISTTYYY